MESMSIKELSNRVKMIHCTSDSIRRGRGMRQNNIEIQKSRPDPQLMSLFSILTLASRPFLLIVLLPHFPSLVF